MIGTVGTFAVLVCIRQTDDVGFMMILQCRRLVILFEYLSHRFALLQPRPRRASRGQPSSKTQFAKLSNGQLKTDTYLNV